MAWNIGSHQEKVSCPVCKVTVEARCIGRYPEKRAVRGRYGCYSEEDRQFAHAKKRWGPDRDCATHIILPCERAGIPLRTLGATFTGDLEPALKKSGATNVITKVNIQTGEGLKRCDILLRPKTSSRGGHAAWYLGDKKISHAVSDENGKISGGESGDQTGKEVREEDTYYNGQWTSVWRFPEEEGIAETGKKTVAELATEVLAGKWGNMPARKTRIEAEGYDFQSVQNEVNRLLNGADTPVEQEPGTMVGAVNGKTVNVRLGPGTGAEIKQVAQKGDLMRFNGKRTVNGSLWLRNTTGVWIIASYITYTSGVKQNKLPNY